MKGSPKQTSAFEALPSVDELMRSESAQNLLREVGRKRLTELARQAIGDLRNELQTGGDLKGISKAELLNKATSLLEMKWKNSLSIGTRRVINATGVIIHTNLGRAPLSDAARKAVGDAAGYCNLEYDLQTGLRGKRGGRVESMLCELTGAEDALVVNNCAAAAFFVLTVFAAGREVMISRGELVEIGGDFRVPDVLSRSGAELCEVGTTNRTKLADYEKAIGEKTAMILRVHPSNYRILGFTAAPTLSELAELAHSGSILLYEDAGSGAMTDLSTFGLKDEPVIRDSIAEGADIVTFSGDKLLGGPQAGIIVGRRVLIEKLRKDPLHRALRVDKLTLAALEATLEAHLRGTADQDVPVVRMLAARKSEIEQRARALAEKVEKSGLSAELIDGNSALGGGAAPLTHPETILIALRHATLSATELDAKLRAASAPVIARIFDDRVVLDLRTVSESEEGDLISALQSV
jgi:L-seryl-tRNA(Ser) seleniumtransferase